MEHKTARGKSFNMAVFSEQQGSKPALTGFLGGTRMNAAGDILGNNGKIILKRQDIMEQYYKENTNRVQKMSLPSNSTAAIPQPIDMTKTPEQILKETYNQQEIELAAMRAELENNPNLINQDELKKPAAKRNPTPTPNVMATPAPSVMASATEISDKEKKLKD